MLRFLLLGASDCANPSAITKEQLKTWESQALITYLGESSEVRDHIGSCSCVVLPSYYKEGVPRVLLEAMSMGKPIITTNVSGCKECIKPPFIKKGRAPHRTKWNPHTAQKPNRPRTRHTNPSSPPPHAASQNGRGGQAVCQGAI